MSRRGFKSFRGPPIIWFPSGGGGGFGGGAWKAAADLEVLVVEVLAEVEPADPGKKRI
jgi:hypothetical protein